MTGVGSYATFSGILYYDSSKWGGKTLRLYEIYRHSDGAMRLKYPKQNVPDGKSPAYRRDDGFSENTDSVRFMEIETRDARQIEGAVLTERDENFAEIKKTDIFEDLARGDKGLLYRLDPRTRYVVFTIAKSKNFRSLRNLHGNETTRARGVSAAHSSIVRFSDEKIDAYVKKFGQIPKIGRGRLDLSAFQIGNFPLRHAEFFAEFRLLQLFFLPEYLQIFRKRNLHKSRADNICMKKFIDKNCLYKLPITARRN